MRRTLISLSAIIVLAGGGLSAQELKSTHSKHLWFYMPTNMLVDENVTKDIALLERAAKAGYNGVLLADSKFMRWDILPDRYAQNVRRVRQACRDLKIDCIAAVCPIGYSNDLLSRDPNLAEGLPVVNAPFVARDGKLVPADESAALVNGSFEQHRNNMPGGWGFVDSPGKVSFIDTEVVFEGKCSLRMEDIGVRNPPHGHGRMNQTLKVAPFRYYHVSAAVKTENFEAANEIRIAVLAKDGMSLNHYQPRVAKTQDWKRIDATFNSLENTEVLVYLGVWGGRRGKIWWDDVRLEPAGLVNVVRRVGAPLRATSEDGKTAFVEGKDFGLIRDPKLGADPYPGSFTAWHEQPVVAIPSGSGIRDGQKLLLNYYHTAIIHHDQVMCCMAEPKVYDILQWHVAQVHKNVQPDGYFLSHDEIRVQGWDQSCRHTDVTPGRLLAGNFARCVRIVRKEDPGKTIYVWSDMFDPLHNAPKTGKYYLVRGDGPWYGSWQGLPKDVVICNWNSDPKKRTDSLKHFAALGHKQILAGYYDGPVAAITPWLEDARKAGGVLGVMYTTWQNRYNDLEAFAKEVRPGSTESTP